MSTNKKGTGSKKATNSRSNFTWVSPSFAKGFFTSKNARIDQLSRLNFFIKKMEVVEKDEFVFEGKTIPKQNALRVHAVAEFDESVGDEKFCLEMPLSERFKVCNVFVNKLAFAVDMGVDWDGFCQLSIYTPKGGENTRLFCTFFTDEEAESLNLPEERNLFPYSDELKGFDGLPPMPVIMHKGKPLVKEGRTQYDTDEFDAFVLELVNDLCDRINERNF